MQVDVQTQQHDITKMLARLQRAEEPYVEMQPDTGELSVRTASRLGRTLQALCRAPADSDATGDAESRSPVVSAEEIRMLLRVRL